MLLPETLNVPLPDVAATVPVEVWPSPQVMVAVYRPTLALGSGSVNVATTPVKLLPSIGLTLMPWESGAVRFLKDSALRVAVGLAIVLNAAQIVATMSGR